MSRGRDVPPSEWFPGAVKLTDDTYAAAGDTPADTFVWHWCVAVDRWEGAMCSSHQLIAREPLHLEPSLACSYNIVADGAPSCPWHGWIRNGQWVSV